VTEDGTSPPLTIGKLGEYEVTLTVEDAAGNTATDTLTVTVLDTTTPVADAGDDIQVDQHTTVTFDGSGSTDNVAIVTHRWQMNYFGHGQDQVLIGPNPEFTFDRVGEYTVTLAVTDAAGNMATDGVTVTVLDIDPPVAVAGNDSVAMMGDTVTLDGTASLDNVGITNWTWTFTYRGEERTLEGEVATFTFERVGEFVITLTVADGRGNTAEDTLRLYVKDATPQDVLADGELSTALVAGIVVLVVVAVLVAVVLVMRRRSG